MVSVIGGKIDYCSNREKYSPSLPLHRLPKDERHHFVQLLLRADKIIISGNPKEYAKIADSGNKRIQAFCSEWEHNFMQLMLIKEITI